MMFNEEPTNSTQIALRKKITRVPDTQTILHFVLCQNVIVSSIRVVVTYGWGFFTKHVFH